VSSEDAVMTARDVVRAARQSINAAGERLSLGDAVLVFPEGTRTRIKHMQPFLSGVTRYLEHERAWIMPVGITGTEMLFPVGDELLHPFPVVIRAGQPFRAQALAAAARDDRRLMLDTIGVSIANLLPPEYQGVYGPAVEGLDDARRLALELSRR
jgi:1-acyl-sn-glycerol-3-phosphate acyltransferase